MSFQAMTWAVQQKCGSASAKIVLLMLANHTNGHTGACNPRHKLLAEECEMSVETLKNHLKKLSEIGLISIVHKFMDGVQLPNQYVMNFEGGGGEKHPQGGGEKHPPYNQEDNQEDNHILSPDKSDDEKPAVGVQEKAKPAGLPDCPHLELLDIFAEQLPELPQPKPELWGGRRAKNLSSRWKWCLTAKKRSGERYATNKAEALEFFRRYFTYVAKSEFLTGRDGRWSGCDLAWLVKADNFAKVLQGNYENKVAA